jgi:KaiC/GvpD/RAD55 family RecA-like ATPase
MEEIETLRHKAAQYEADEMHMDAVASTKEVRVRTGVRRLDDLVFGGFPTGSQVLVNGPAHTGKDVLARLFVAEGLKAGLPALWVVTDKTFTQIREEMTGLFPPYPEFEARGLVRYVDLYARNLGVTQAEPMVKLLSLTDKNALELITTAVNHFSQELKEKAPAYRVVFETVSTLTAYLDSSGMFRFLQPFVGRRKLDGAASYYVLETGMHTDSDLQTLEHMMDGSLNLKVDQLKTFLSVKGITESQSRAWIGYTFTKRSFSLGSFSLDHIR